jgi:hypothetical protein
MTYRSYRDFEMADVWLGLDLGQHIDYSAAAVIRRALAIDPMTGWPQRASTGFPFYRFDVMAIRRYPLGAAYRDIVAHVVEHLRRPELHWGGPPRLVIDATGVGNAVVEMFRTALLPHPQLECWAVTITAGRAVTLTGYRMMNVAKIELVGSIRSALESQRIKVAPTLEHADTLKRELADFRVKVTEAGHETFNAREGAHDDLVLAVSLPIWLANQRWTEMYVDPERPGPHEAVTPSSEQAAIERAERQAVAAERSGRRERILLEERSRHDAEVERRRQEAGARQNLNQLDLDSDHWWE